MRKAKYKLNDRVKIVRLDDPSTARNLIGKEGVIDEIDPLPNGQFNYYVQCADGSHYMHEE